MCLMMEWLRLLGVRLHVSDDGVVEAVGSEAVSDDGVVVAAGSEAVSDVGVVVVAVGS